MLLLLVPSALARDVLVVGEREVPADVDAWPGALAACLDAARPGGYAVVDATVPAPSPSVVRDGLAAFAADSDALVLLALPRRAELGLVDRARWAWALDDVLEGVAAFGRPAVVLGPWPAGRQLVRPTGSIPASAVGIGREEPEWLDIDARATALGLAHPDGRPTAADRARLPPVPPRSTPTTAVLDAWAPYPLQDATSLGRVACAWVLGQG